MDDPFRELKKIVDECYKTQEVVFAKEAIQILNKNGIKLRQRNGSPVQANISFPNDSSTSIMLGIRYVKEDKSNAEDLFLFAENKEIQPFYKGKAEKLFPEYKGTHHRSIENT
jgi:hypothetical protein